ncbi:MAG: FGGY-family carbohydrate kinase [Spirochaetota bacterium]
MYYLGLDYGGTQIKAALYDEDGVERAIAMRPSQVETPAPQIVEIDMETLWHSASLCIRDLLQEFNPKDIVGISTSSHGKGLYLLDDKGQPCGKGILSADTRSIELLNSWRRQERDQALYPYILQELWPPHPLVLLGHLQQHDAQRLERSRHICMGHDYLRYRLSGEIAAERSNISGSGLVDIRKRDYSTEVLEQTELQSIRSKLPPILDSAALAGRVHQEASQATGLLQGTPVYGGFFDVVGAAVASGLRSENDYHAIMGTWSISTCLSSQIITNSSTNSSVELPKIPWGNYALPGMYFVHDGSPSSASNLNWFLEQFSSKPPDFSHNDTILQRMSPVDNQLFFYPYLYASNLGNPGTLIGLQSHHCYDDILYAVYEGILMAHMVHMEKLKAIQALPRRLLLTGGPSQSRPWMQMFADFSGLSVLTLQGTKESGCKGAAMAAAVGGGQFPDFPAAMAAWVHYHEPLSPVSERRQDWKAKYQRYLEIGRHIAQKY